MKASGRSTDGSERTRSDIHNIVIGTAGHIDHGKTALIHRLTGIDADRLPEERERGMTIDLGFARFRLQDGRRIGIIDVPGHERFIKNMVAGATGIDLVVLVVAADDGVMPQTREHLEIMKLLGLEHGLVVVTKKDLVNEELLELAVEDAREAIAGTFLEDAPLVTVSSVTGEGFDDLLEALHRQIEKVVPRSTVGVFRMPIQRIFSAKGFGTILTGIPVTGTARIGDTLEVVPPGLRGRVRGIQAYLESAELARAGQSSALNVTDVDYKLVRRGMVLATPGHMEAAALLEARFHYLQSNPRPLRHLTRIRFHSGTAEVIGHIYLLEKKQLEPGESALVQIRLEDPVVVLPGDHYVLRLHSPMITIGGGEIIDLSRWRLKQGKSFVIERVRSKESALGSPVERLLLRVEELGFEAFSEEDLAPRSGLPPAELHALFERLSHEGAIRRTGRPGLFVSAGQFEEALGRARRIAEGFFERSPRRLLMEKLELRRELPCHDVFFTEILAELESTGTAWTVRGEFLRWAFHEPRLPEREARFRETLLREIREAPFSPPAVEEVARRERVPAEAAEQLASLLLEEGELVRLAEGVLFHREAVEKARQEIQAHLERTGSMTASQARTVLGSTRKYVIPLLELFDREGFTIRRGDLRELRRKH